MSEHHRPKPGRPEPAPELSFGLRVESQGVRQVRAGARGKPAIVALQRVLIVLVLVGGAVAIVWSLRTSPEQPLCPDLGGRYTEHLEHTPHTEYIERSCTRTGS